MEVLLHQCAQQGNRQQQLQKALDVLYPDLSSTFDTASSSMEKLPGLGLDLCSVSGVKNCYKYLGFFLF